MKKLAVLLFGFLVLVGLTSTAAMADGITFSFSVTTGTVTTTINQFGSPSLVAGPVGGAVVVKDTDTSLSLVLPAGSTGMIQSDNNISYSAGDPLLIASYAGSGVTQVEILSSFCPGGICLSGTNSLGTYTAFQGGGGGFGGVFDVTFASPAILAFFGDSTDSVNPNGGTAFTTSSNTWTTGGTMSTAQFGSGSITFETTADDGVAVPEPGTLALLGTGLFALASVMRRKKLFKK